jgi:hypothetical protein
VRRYAPDRDPGADSVNPCGSRAPRKAVCLNEAILQRRRSALYEPTLRLQGEDLFDAKERAACVGEIGAFLTRVRAAPLVVIKEAEVTLLHGVWFEAARLAGFDIHDVIAVRHPQEAIASFAGAPSRLAGGLECRVAETHSAGRETHAARRACPSSTPTSSTTDAGNKADFDAAHDRSHHPG